jgi:hypothetical protein
VVERSGIVSIGARAGMLHTGRAHALQRRVMHERLDMFRKLHERGRVPERGVIRLVCAALRPGAYTRPLFGSM